MVGGRRKRSVATTYRDFSLSDEKKTLIQAHTGVLIGEGELYDLWIVKRAYFECEDKG